MARLTVEEAADYLRMSANTLKYLRHLGRGPRYFKPAKRVLYDTRELDRWLEDSRRRSTAEVPRPRRAPGRPRKVEATP